MNAFKIILQIAQKQQEILTLVLVALLTAGGEHIFSNAIFDCPCNYLNFTYGMVFVLVPAFALFVLGYILSKRAWKLFTGICLRKSEFHFWSLLKITTKAMVAPLSWLAVALMNGEYFECAMTGVKRTVFRTRLCLEEDQQCWAELLLFPCQKGNWSLQRVDEAMSTLRAESQILGWLLIASVLVSNLLLVCVNRCKSPFSYLQLTFWKTYVQQEGQLMKTFSKDHARDLAKRNLNSFFQGQAPEPITIPSEEAWQNISKFYCFSPRDEHYSRLHQYVETDLGTDRTRQALLPFNVVDSCPAKVSTF